MALFLFGLILYLLGRSAPNRFVKDVGILFMILPLAFILLGLSLGFMITFPFLFLVTVLVFIAFLV